MLPSKDIHVQKYQIPSMSLLISPLDTCTSSIDIDVQFSRYMYSSLDTCTVL